MFLHMIRVAVDFGMLILILLVQLIIYPSFEFSAKESFVQWHERYTGLITFVVLPLMLAQLGLAVAEVIRQRSMATGVCLALIAFCWIVTFTLSVPGHNDLQANGNTPQAVRFLVMTNWLRTIAWTAVSVISIWHFYRLSMKVE